MSALVLDAGALIAIDRGDRSVLSEVNRALRSRLPVRTNAMALAQAWRDGKGRQATLARALQDITVEPITRQDGMRAGNSSARLACGTRLMPVSRCLPDPVTEY
jgi:hypothetical protein